MGSIRAAAFVALMLYNFTLFPVRTDAKPMALNVTYLGNEGFLVRSGSRAVLFDALFGVGLPEYDHVPVAVVHDMEAARPPFENIDLVFISHVHPDHFDVQSTVRFLNSHPSAIVVAPTEVFERLRGALTGDIPTISQVHAVSADKGRISTLQERGIEIGAFPLAHGNVENLAYLVRLDGRTVLHLGDADLPLNDLPDLKLFANAIDVAFVPFWQLTENAEAIRDQVGSKIIVPMHLIVHPSTAASKGYLVHVGGRPGMLTKIRSEFPNAFVLERPLETKIF
jgi:L-ascorbate metabolism protein UlaG (beta-lactamase superfamily)